MEIKPSSSSPPPSRAAWQFFRFFKPYRLAVGATLFFLILAKVAATLDPLYLRNIIDAIAARQPLAMIMTFVVIYFALRLGENLGQLLRDYLFAPVIMGVSWDIEKAVFAHLLRLPVSYHADQQAGSAARQLARGSRAISFILDFSVSQLIPPIFELLFVTILLLRFYTWEFGVITVVTVIIYTWFTIWSTDKRQIFRQGANVQDDAASGSLIDSIANIETVKYFNHEGRQYNQFMGFKKIWFDLSVKSNKLFAIIFSAQGFILLVGLGLILILAVRQAAAGAITVGDLVLVSTYIVRLTIPISTLGFVYGQFKNSFTDLEAMGSILAREVTIKEPAQPMTISHPKGEIIFDHVAFHYPGRHHTIDDLSVKIAPGQKAAFVGASGAGKSTLSKLLFRLYDVSKGTIRIDGVNIKDLAADSRRAIMAVVPQEPTLFNDTIAANIRFGKPDATDQEIIAAAKAAHIDDFILGLPQKYDTLVGERGIKISGGERQRVAIARAIIKDPKILIFDEATSSLDSRSEQAILATLDEVSAGRTTLAIAHRLSTIIHSDIIYVLQHGRVVEQGTHDALLKQGGVYASLWQIQSKRGRRRSLSSRLDA